MHRLPDLNGNGIVTEYKLFLEQILLNLLTK